MRGSDRINAKQARLNAGGEGERGGVGGKIVALTLDELRAISRYATDCAHTTLTIFEVARPSDGRPRGAIDAAAAFAHGGPRTTHLRDAAWGAWRAARDARDAGEVAACQAGRSAAAAAGAAYLHPLANSNQVKHILGSAAHAIRALELSQVGELGSHVPAFRALARDEVTEVLRRYPPAPMGGGRVGEILRCLDFALR